MPKSETQSETSPSATACPVNALFAPTNVVPISLSHVAADPNVSAARALLYGVFPISNTSAGSGTTCASDCKGPLTVSCASARYARPPSPRAGVRDAPMPTPLFEASANVENVSKRRSR